MNEETKNWAAFGSDYIKAIEVLNNTDEYAIVGVNSEHEDNKVTLILEIERNEIKKKFGCNKTNLYAVQQECQTNPEEAIGRVITFNKVKVTNPQTKLIVDGLRLQFKPKVEPTQVDTDDAGIADDSTM